MQILSIFTLIGIIFFMIVNLVIYHKIFTVTYFNLGKGCLTELIFAWLVAMVEVGLIIRFGGSLLKLLLFIGKLILIGAAAILAILIICKIVQTVRGKNDAQETGNSNNVPLQNTQEVNVQEELADAVQCETVDGHVNIEVGEVGSEKVVANHDLTGKKDFIESSVKALKRISGDKADDVKNRLKVQIAKSKMMLSQETEVLPEKQNNTHMIVCVNCGKIVDDDAKFCSCCGNKIIKPHITVCVNCGKPIIEDANFCQFCGEKTGKEDL